MPLSVNGLVHIPGFGDYQMTCIEECKDPFPLKQEKTKSGQDIEMDEEKKIVAVADSNVQVRFFPSMLTEFQLFTATSILTLYFCQSTNKKLFIFY